MAQKNRYRDQVRIGDYQVYCTVCGAVCWYSESFILGPYTGHEGQLVCPDHNYQPQYGLQPYVIEPEEPVPFAQPNQIVYTQNSVIPNFITFDPLSGGLPSDSEFATIDQDLQIVDQDTYIIGS